MSFAEHEDRRQTSRARRSRTMSYPCLPGSTLMSRTITSNSSLQAVADHVVPVEFHCGHESLGYQSPPDRLGQAPSSSTTSTRTTGPVSFDFTSCSDAQ